MDFSFGSLLSLLSNYMTIWFVVPGIIILGAYLTWRLRCVQVTRMKMAFSSIFEKKEEKGNQGDGDVSRFKAMASVLASSFGTGNIAGMAVALSTGGPGALFWMWVITFLVSSVQFANCLLGVKYRKKDERGEYQGGPMHYLTFGLGWKKLAPLFAFLLIISAFTCGPLVQANSVALPLINIGIPSWVSGLAMAVIVGAAILGGTKRIAGVASTIVPVMASLYLGGAFLALVLFHNQLLFALGLIIKGAFGLGPIVSGAVGFGVMQAIIFGANRSIFATTAGTGLAPLLQSGTCSKNPVIDGISSLIAPFLVMLVCTATVLVLMVTGAFQEVNLQSTNMVLFAFSKALGNVGAWIVFVALFLFGYSTMIGMGACLDRSVLYLFGERWLKPFRWIYILMVPIGAVLHVSLAWSLADISLAIMVVINLLAVAGLSREVIVDHNNFFYKKPGVPEKEPAQE